VTRLDGAATSASTPATPSALAVVVPFKYDLGGRIIDHQACRRELAEFCLGPIEEDQALARSWNLSYLVRHAVVLRGVLGTGRAWLGGSEWSFQRSLRLYPWLGVISIDYLFTTDDPNVRLVEFYDDLVSWKNTDYLPYLRDCGAMTPELAAHTASAAGPPQDLHGGLVRDLRRRIRPFLDLRPAVYAFHDFRTVFLDVGSTLDAATVDSLLLLSRSAPGDELSIPTLRTEDVEVHSTGWATVLRSQPGTDLTAFRDVLSMLSLVHAQWYVCQAWINVYDYDVVRGPNRQEPADAEDLASAQLALGQDLTEVGNMDLMLKDPGLLRVARYFEQVFDVNNHLNAAERRLRVLEEYSRGLAEQRQTRAANRLQVLFALSAAGSIAGLIPSLVEIELPTGVTLLTVAVVITLWLGFAFAFSREQRARLRKPRR